MRIAILGMGNMGRAFADRALARGHQVTVWNRTPGRADDLVRRGAVEASSSRSAVLEADCVLLVLSDDAAVLDVCLGDDGVLTALGPTAVMADISTVSPETARRLADVGPPGRVLDTPVAGSPSAISAGQGRFLIGGPKSAITAVGSVWDDLGAGYVHCGPSGAGATVKAVVNFLLITGVAALAEAIATARHHGVSDELLRGVLASSPVVSETSKARLDGLMNEEHQGWFSPALARKDLRIANALAEQAGVKARIGPAADALLTTIVESGVQWPDFSAVIEALA